MEIRQVLTHALVMDSSEVKQLIEILDYAYHRATQHDCYINGHYKFIDYARKKLKETQGR